MIAISQLLLSKINLRRYCEGWQVAPFRNPLVAEQEAEVQVADFNNEWLREVAYKLIFVMQYISLQMFSVGVFGLGKAVQVDPIKPTLTAPGTKRLKL